MRGKLRFDIDEKSRAMGVEGVITGLKLLLDIDSYLSQLSMAVLCTLFDIRIEFVVFACLNLLHSLM